MSDPGVTLHLMLSGEPSDATVRAWIGSLAAAGSPARLALGPVVVLERLRERVRGLCEDAGVELVEAPGADDVVVVAEANDLPGPHLVTRLAAAVANGGTDVADARTLPVDLSVQAPAEDGSQVTRSVVGACVALAASAWAELGRASGPELVERLAQAGLRTAHRAEATVLRDVRFDGQGALLPGRPALSPQSPDTADAPPSGHPAALPATTLAQVASYAGLSVPEADTTERPFLSVVTRTQGLRLQCLAEMLTCLVAQTSRDFEVVLVCHRVSDEARAAVEHVVAEQPEWLRSRVRLVESERDGRAAPLNDGFQAADGRYVVALDDDDTVLSHWVETFRRTEQTAPGAVLRAGALRQDVVPLEVPTAHGDATCPTALTPAFPDWPLDFSLVDHLRANFSPFMTVAFPRGVVQELGLRFDESLATTEDWHFLVRAAGLVGVTDAGEMTSVYRWWTTEGSRALHDEEEWERGHEAVRRSFDEQVLLLPPGSAHVFTDLHRERDEARAQAEATATSQQQVIEELAEAVAAHDRAVASRDAYQARAAELEARVAELEEKAAERRELQQERLDLMREAHALLDAKRAQVPGGQSLFDLNRKQLTRLITRLDSQGPTPTSSRFRLRRLL